MPPGTSALLLRSGRVLTRCAKGCWVACSMVGRRLAIAAVAVLAAGMAFVPAAPKAEAVGVPVLTIDSAARICPDVDGFFHLDVTVTGDAPNVSRQLVANIGQNYPISSYPALATNSLGVIPLTNVVLENPLDLQVLSDTTVTIDLVAYGDPSQRVLAHTVSSCRLAVVQRSRQCRVPTTHRRLARRRVSGLPT